MEEKVQQGPTPLQVLLGLGPHGEAFHEAVLLKMQAVLTERQIESQEVVGVVDELSTMDTVWMQALVLLALCESDKLKNSFRNDPRRDSFLEGLYQLREKEFTNLVQKGGFPAFVNSCVELYLKS
jgi:hypothetical protein